MTQKLVFVLPGGGYGMRADHEGRPVAEWLRSLGHRAEVLDYPIAPHRHPAGRNYVQAAISRARESFGGLVGVLGFSAGAHLAGMVAYSSDSPESARPDFVVLGYPVVLLGSGGHAGSRDNLLGADPGLAEALSLHNIVTSEAPPSFVWHGADDEVVPVHHSLLLAGALATHSAPFALHVFERGAHGLGLATGEACEAWTSLCADWLDSPVHTSGISSEE